MNCTNCNAPDISLRDPYLEWAVCMTCGTIMRVEWQTDHFVPREAEPQEFMDLVNDSRTYGMLLLLQDEIKARSSRRPRAK